jgi:hypothetical protein
MSQPAAEEACNNIGAHLAAFASAEEQAEVETLFTAAGYLLPAFHKSYWLGLESKVLYQPDEFKWMDKSVAGGQSRAPGLAGGMPLATDDHLPRCGRHALLACWKQMADPSAPLQARREATSTGAS